MVKSNSTIGSVHGLLRPVIFQSFHKNLCFVREVLMALRTEGSEQGGHDQSCRSCNWTWVGPLRDQKNHGFKK